MRQIYACIAEQKELYFHYRYPAATWFDDLRSLAILAVSVDVFGGDEMDVDASGREARVGGGSLQSRIAEHEHWKFGILQDVMVYLDEVPRSVKDGVSVSAARMRGLLQISQQLAKLARTIGKEDGARSVYSNSLTARQEEIMLLLDMGIRPKEIAHRLTLSEATVRTHIRDARRLLGIKREMNGEQS
jgi:DNA-binding CsgD family transcriptional regulator